MKTFDDIQVEGHLRVLIWSHPGAGKTALAATFPSVVFVDSDLGLKTLKSRWFKSWLGRKPDLIGFETFDDDYDRWGLFKPQADVKQYAVMRAIAFINEVAKDDRVKTVVIDSLTTFQSLAVHMGLDLAGRGKRSKTLDAAKDTKVALLTQADYGAEMSVFEQFVDQLVQIPKNIVCIAHERDISSEKGALIRREPYLIGSSVRAKIAKWFDEVWYLDAGGKGGQRKILTQPTNIMKVNKTRLGVPDGLEDPTYKKLITSIGLQ